MKNKMCLSFKNQVLCVLSVQSQVDEVIDVMQENISKVIERGERLDDLQDKSGELHRHSVGFCVSTHTENTCAAFNYKLK